MAFQDHKKVNISSNDFVIISATPIPGNEKSVGKVVNELMRHGAEVVYEKMYDVHVSGHANQEELKLMLSLIKPRYFIPVHGEQKHLSKHAMLANQVGMSSKDIIIAEIGKTVEVCEGTFRENGMVPAGRVLVDGSGVGDVGQVVLRDRTKLAQDGIITVVLTIDSAANEIVAGPDIVSRGFVYVRESEEIIGEMEQVALEAAQDCLDNDIRDWASIKASIRDEVSQIVYERTRRTPMILPIIMEV